MEMAIESRTDGSKTPMSFQVDMTQYSGPVELLLYLVRREELPLCDISLAKLTEQYIAYLEVLTELTIDDVGDFLEIASILVEMKAKAVLPQSPVVTEDEAETLEDPSDQLVQRLMDYKRIRDAASILDEQGGRWQLRYTRMADDLPPRRTDIDQQPLQGLEVWDLVSAFGRILRERTPPPSANVIYDDTPIHVYMQRIHQQVCDAGRVELTSLFAAGMHKSSLVAMFLATLELTRHHGLKTEQTEPGLPLYLVADKDFSRKLDVHEIGNLSFEKVAASNLPVTPR
jgi:segregation and condensation protein A